MALDRHLIRDGPSSSSLRISRFYYYLRNCAGEITIDVQSKIPDGCHRVRGKSNNSCRAFRFTWNGIRSVLESLMECALTDIGLWVVVIAIKKLAFKLPRQKLSDCATKCAVSLAMQPGESQCAAQQSIVDCIVPLPTSRNPCQHVAVRQASLLERCSRGMLHVRSAAGFKRLIESIP